MIHDSHPASAASNSRRQADDCCVPTTVSPSRARRWLQEQHGERGVSERAALPPSDDRLPDVQATPDLRRIRIDRVGISALRHPLRVVGRSGAAQTTVGTFRMTVALPAERKGTHMSRFLEVLGEHADDLSPAGMRTMAEAVRERLDAPEAQIEVEFPYFIAKPAPVTGRVGLMDYEVSMRCDVDHEGADLTLELAASATSLCPCSKLISAYGAHNQRCRIVAAIRPAPVRPAEQGAVPEMTIEDLASIVESAASAEVYSVLKRPDEKFVTERAFEQPKFVEDIIRDLAMALDAEARVGWYRISSENFESIHSHNAYAEIERDKAM